MREDIIKKVEKFLWDNLCKSINYKGYTKRGVEYRFEHSWRVANIGKMIAQAEGFNEERLVVACLLHDIGYSIDFKDFEDYNSHGRHGARISRPFLLELGYTKEEVEEMCYGIALHVDNVADFEFEKTSFALSINDADNIDRFDAYRLYESLHTADYMNLPLSEQKEWLKNKINYLKEIRENKCATKTAEKIWYEKIDFQIEFLNKLKKQIDFSSINSMLRE